jgi:hypothetical protein
VTHAGGAHGRVQRTGRPGRSEQKGPVAEQSRFGTDPAHGAALEHYARPWQAVVLESDHREMILDTGSDAGLTPKQ